MYMKVLLILLLVLASSCSKTSDQTTNGTPAIDKTATLVVADNDRNKTVYRASSEYTENGKLYSAQFAFDSDRSTAWAESNPEYGINEWIEVEYPEAIECIGLEILPGYQKTLELYQNNSVPSLVEVIVNDIVIGKYSTRMNSGFNYDKGNTYPNIDEALSYKRLLVFPTTIKVKKIRIKILDVIPGIKWSDALITEITPISISNDAYNAIYNLQNNRYYLFDKIDDRNILDINDDIKLQFMDYTISRSEAERKEGQSSFKLSDSDLTNYINYFRNMFIGNTVLFLSRNNLNIFIGNKSYVFGGSERYIGFPFISISNSKLIMSELQITGGSPDPDFEAPTFYNIN